MKTKQSGEGYDCSRISSKIWGWAKTNGVSVGDMAIYAMMAESTMYARLKHPKDFRMSELMDLSKLMGVTVEALIGA